MPWSIVQGHSDCAVGQWAVVKDSDGSVEGCHDTKDEAMAQLAALNIAESDSMNPRLEQLYTELRAGRVLSQANERKLREAVEALNAVLDQLAAEENGRAQPDTVEMRTMPVDAVELRQMEDGSQRIAGHAAVFNRLSVPLWGFRERIQPGAFAQALTGEADVRALWQHDVSRVLGRTKNGTLRLWEDDEGLAFELDPPDTQDGRDAMTLIGRGDIDQMSFGFTVMPEGDQWTDDEQEGIIRDLVTVDLKEISPVTWAAYPQTDVSVAMRSAPDWVRQQVYFERRGALSDLLNELIDAMETDERPRSEIVQAMADAAGIEPTTVNQILNGSIQCPPRERLNGFADTLNVSLDRLLSAAESDGCDYGRAAPERQRAFRDGDGHRRDDDQWRALLGIQRKRVDLAEMEL